MADQVSGRISRSPDRVTRRRVLGGLAATVLLTGIAGCTTGVEEEPDADVVWHETDPSIEDVSVQQEVEVTAMVANLGHPGAVRVIAETLTAGREEPLDTKTVTIEMDQDEQREISFEMEVSPAADVLETRAEAA